MVQGLLPVNLSAGSLHAAVARSKEPAAAQDEGPVAVHPSPDVPAPEQLSMWEQENYQFSASAAGSLGFPLWSSSTDDRARIILFGVSRYSDVDSGRHTYRYGVAIRVLIEILDFKVAAKASLPAIAAQVQLGDLQASSLLMVSGYAGNISATLPAWQDFDVKSYSDYFAAITNLQKIIFDDTANIRPVLLGSTLAAGLVENGLDRPGSDRTQKGQRHFGIFHPFSGVD